VTAPVMLSETSNRMVVELDHGVTVYPAREPGGRWRAVWYEDGRRRQCEAASEVEAFAATLRSQRSEQPLRDSATRRATKTHEFHPAAPPRRITGKIRAVRTRKGTS